MLRKEPRTFLGIRPVRDHRQAAMLPRSGAVGLCIIAFVGDDGPWRDVRIELEQRLELPAVGCLGAGQVEVERMAVEVAFDVDFGAEPAAGTAKCLILLPPFAPAAETWARAVVLSNIWINAALSL